MGVERILPHGHVLRANGLLVDVQRHLDIIEANGGGVIAHDQREGAEPRRADGAQHLRQCHRRERPLGVRPDGHARHRRRLPIFPCGRAMICFR